PVESDSVDLFIDRARNSGASLRPEDRTVIEEICSHVDGIPLAIELAAARVRAMPLTELAARLATRLDVLGVRRHGRDDRHRTMRATLDWSYELLDDDERVVFARVSVFSGSFDLAAAEAVITGAPLDSDVLEVLGALVDKSMVVADTDSRTPFHLLEPLRQYAADQLAARRETADLARRHAAYYADLSSQLTARRESGRTRRDRSGRPARCCPCQPTRRVRHRHLVRRRRSRPWHRCSPSPVHQHPRVGRTMVLVSQCACPSRR
ncbi:MAG TPA: hypothetical protein VFV63_14800, partial [Ilumatobacteraceae bacterium]|nr:hypothetical protein [Ilumatobacteraceae bacterium]